MADLGLTRPLEAALDNSAALSRRIKTAAKIELPFQPISSLRKYLAHQGLDVN